MSYAGEKKKKKNRRAREGSGTQRPECRGQVAILNQVVMVELIEKWDVSKDVKKVSISQVDLGQDCSREKE